MILKDPWMLPLFLLVPLWGWLFRRARRLQRQAAALLCGGAPDRGGLARADRLRLGALVLLIVALARPEWNPHPNPVARHRRGLTIALDISRSMLAADVFPSRLEAARIALFECLETLRGQRVGLITFAGAAAVRVPLTLDHGFVRYMLERAGPSDAEVGSTSLQAAIEKAVDTMLPATEKGRQDLLILTDGEDHISDIPKTAEALRDSGVRVLIVGLGDPVGGARVPAEGDTNAWMQYEGRDVISRLDEEKLRLLSAASPNVTYYPAGTRPFDLPALYREMTAKAPAGPDDLTETEIIRTEGYPYFIAAGLLLWWLAAAVPRITRPPLVPMLLAGLTLSLSGCHRPQADPEAMSIERYNAGCATAKAALALGDTDPRAALAALQEAREAFLQAALLRPGHPLTARQIVTLSAHIRQMEIKARAREEEEQKQQQQLQAALELLKELTLREAALSQQSQQALSRRPPPPPETLAELAAKSRAEQTTLRDGTQSVLAILEPLQQMVRHMLSKVFDEQEKAPPTEFDRPVELIQGALEAQQKAVDHWAPEATAWPQANSNVRLAVNQMQQALEWLTAQNSGQDADRDGEPEDAGDNEWEMDESAEWAESDRESNLSLPMQSGGFKTALENRAMPVPNYTAEEILLEEAAQQKQRAQQKAGRAARVEKNW